MEGEGKMMIVKQVYLFSSHTGCKIKNDIISIKNPCPIRFWLDLGIDEILKK